MTRAPQTGDARPGGAATSRELAALPGRRVARAAGRPAAAGAAPARLLLAGLALLAAAPAWGLPPVARPREGRPQTQPATTQATRPTTSQATTTTTTTTTTSSAPAEKKEPRWLAVVGGRVHTVTGPVYEKATVLCKDGVIVAIGPDVRVPPECEVVDATGRDVYPGLVAVSASGIHGGGDPRDTTNVFGLNMQIALAGGITTALAGNHAAKLTYGSVEDILLRKDLYVSLDYSKRNPATAAELRADLAKVRDYLRAKSRWEIDKELDEQAEEPDKEWLKGKYEKYLKLLTGAARGVATANRAGEILPLLELAREFGFELVIRGAFEGWTVAGEFGRSGAMAVVTPRADVRADERANRPTGSTIENAKILYDHGVTVAVIPERALITLWGLAGRDLLHLNMEAAFAVRGGMRNAEALRTITIDAARVLGVDDRVGSLEPGKDADLIVTDGDILSYMTQVHYAVVNGRVAYDKSKSSLYAHIRPEGVAEPVEFDDQWPRRLEWPAAELEASRPPEADAPPAGGRE